MPLDRVNAIGFRSIDVMPVDQTRFALCFLLSDSISLYLHIPSITLY